MSPRKKEKLTMDDSKAAEAHGGTRLVGYWCESALCDEVIAAQVIGDRPDALPERMPCGKCGGTVRRFGEEPIGADGVKAAMDRLRVRSPGFDWYRAAPNPPEPQMRVLAKDSRERIVRDLESGALKLTAARYFEGTGDDGWAIQAVPVTAGAKKRWEGRVIHCTFNPDSPYRARIQAVVHRTLPDLEKA
ncbi:MAG TPA: hypothetical protein VMK12_25865 [Anaeromyxobacteraceae bacterium]|nr:hypothetical protein [Anaeromyxobacteraceae bacterium]